MAKRDPFEIGGQSVAAGTRATVDLPVSVLPDHTPVNMAVHVIHGKRSGPVMFVSAAIHGDEVIGVEIVRRLLKTKPMDRIAGTLLAVPIVNTFGFLNHSRYMPDRRDLNRCFPGTAGGSLASRLAHIFMAEIIARADVGVDLHSAAIQRTNLPQIRLTPDNPRLSELGAAFGAPVMMTSKLREGSLRLAAEAAGVDVLLYEAGEGLRFDEQAAQSGVSGILRVMHHLGMFSAKSVPKLRHPSVICDSSTWYRAPASGLFRSYRRRGEVVEKGTVLGVMSDPFGDTEHEIVSQDNGIIIGRAKMPILHEGDALFHIAIPRRAMDVVEEHMASHMELEPMFDEDEII